MDCVHFVIHIHQMFKRLSIGMFLSIFFKRYFFQIFGVFDLLGPGSPVKSFDGFRESKDTCVDFTS